MAKVFEDCKKVHEGEHEAEALKQRACLEEITLVE